MGTRVAEKKYFGTDGIRGKTNVDPITPECALKLGKAAGTIFRRGTHRHTVVIGKDTRLSGYMIESALIAGFTSAGMDVKTIGPCPTPAIGLLTRSMRADLGVMITASHNLYPDNGIKLFGPDGFKLPDELELEIEALMDDPSGLRATPPEQIGQWSVYADAKGRYVEAAKASFPRDLTLEGVKIVVDCANGAGYKTAPLALWELGADIEIIGNTPNGLNINRDCGSTAPDAMRAKVLESGADIGIALDGDADRVILCNERGEIIDGDQILCRIVLDQLKAGTLRGNAAVATVMSNLGMERRLRDEGVSLERASVGDRYVLEQMRAIGSNVGGEQSGHVVMLDHTTTGDGLVAALQILAACVRSQSKVSEVCDLFEPAAQIKKNIEYMGLSPLNHQPVQDAIKAAQKAAGDQAHIVIRASGTEPLIRVMVQGYDSELVQSLCDDLTGLIQQHASGAAAE